MPLLLPILPLLALLIAHCAYRIARTPRWWLPPSLAFAGLILVILGHRFPRLACLPPFSWAIDISIAPVLMAAIIPSLLVPLMARLPESRAVTSARRNRPRRQQIAIALLGIVVFVLYCLAPIAAPLLVRPALAKTQTRFDPHQVCLQSHPYTCGPAAAVTCLRALHIQADEGPLAIAARCGPLVGTDEAYLAATISQQFGLHAQAGYFLTLDDLTTPAVADTRLFGGHYIAVLAIGSDQVTIGDPINGYAKISRDEFLQIWDHTAITFQPTPAALAKP